ncbi:aminomethyl-transferring glycine dehydrogenase subunit GcvPA [Desulfobacterales bacterium HSG16]|nr:aminomethyl-transferring glycine dehydrogenase subunit GcvPA [Desulfobacterales bacterium HSG16]
MRYLPHTSEDVEAMLQVVGAKTLDDLFTAIPEDCRRKAELDLPEPLTEWELDGHMSALSKEMAPWSEYKVFMGAGSYTHYIPESVRYLLGRSEVSTAYTPYQPEISQGTLQAIFEYQTLTSRLLGMDVANASMYDGASALAEALLMAIRISRKKKKVAVSSLVHPLYRRVINTYFDPTEFEVIEIPYLENGRTDLSALDNVEGLAAVALQSPNFFGCIEDLKAAGDKIHDMGGLLIAGFTEPMAFGLYKNPGSLGADIACGEGQSMGIPQSFGGPGLGMFSAKKKYVRNMPGRLIGKTKDKDGNTGFVLTLATREQHIRREKATSNICSNQGLCATTSCVYMASIGGTGIRELAAINHDKAEYLKKELIKAGFSIPFSSPVFNEFVVKFKKGFSTLHKKLLGKKIVAGLDIAQFYPELEDHYLMCVTETATKDDMDMLVREVKS